ncbi:MAG TPA: FkbM family methyltransferase [Burkholderiales bacterium]
MKAFLQRKFAGLLWRIERRVERAHPLTGVWLDVGAHRGEITLPFAERHPQLEVHAFEPNAPAARGLEDRLKGRLPNYHVHAVAVTEHDGEAEFHVNAFEAASSTLALDPRGLERWSGGEALKVERTLRVPSVRLDSFLNRHGIQAVDWLKIDAQGADLAVVRSLGERLKDVRRVTLEVQTTPYALYQGAADRESVLAFMRRAGFVLAHAELQSRGQEQNLSFERPGATRGREFLGLLDRLLLVAARLLARTRPLAPVPGWRFGADLDRDEAGIRIRKWLFWHFQSLAAEAPIELGWHHGLRLRLPLGADAARCLFVGGRIDPNEFAFLDRVLKPGQVFVDAGANDGLYSLFASRKLGESGTVLAIEPSRRELDHLRQHAVLNRAVNIQVAPVALGAASGKATLMVADGRHAGHNTFGLFGHGGTRCELVADVPVERLDDLLAREALPRLDVLKLDVEGAEAAVLEGARGAIAQSRPLLLVEIFDDALRAQGSSARELIGKLDALGYELYTFDEASGRPRRAREGEALSLNVVAAHRERPWAELAAAS